MLANNNIENDISWGAKNMEKAHELTSQQVEVVTALLQKRYGARFADDQYNIMVAIALAHTPELIEQIVKATPNA